MFIVVMFIQFQVTSPILALHSPQSNPSSSLRVRYLRLWVVLLTALVEMDTPLLDSCPNGAHEAGAPEGVSEDAPKCAHKGAFLAFRHICDQDHGFLI